MASTFLSVVVASFLIAAVSIFLVRVGHGFLWPGIVMGLRQESGQLTTPHSRSRNLVHKFSM